MKQQAIKDAQEEQHYGRLYKKYMAPTWTESQVSNYFKGMPRATREQTFQLIQSKASAKESQVNEWTKYFSQQRSVPMNSEGSSKKRAVGDFAPVVESMASAIPREVPLGGVNTVNVPGESSSMQVDQPEDINAFFRSHPGVSYDEGIDRMSSMLGESLIKSTASINIGAGSIVSGGASGTGNISVQTMNPRLLPDICQISPAFAEVNAQCAVMERSMGNNRATIVKATA